MTQRVLVTGGTGFVGRHLVANLVARGFQVTIATRHPLGTQFSPGFGLKVATVGDLRRDIDWNRYLDGMDAVVHLAALAHIASDISESEYDAINRRPVARLAKAAKKEGVKLIFASSVGAQCGSSTDRVLTENDETTPTTAYGRSKLQAEQEIKEVAADFVILRPTIIYGPGAIGNMQRLVRLALSRVPPPFKLIRNRRSLLAVENMCDAIYFVINSEQANEKTFLLADRDPISTWEMIVQLRLGAGLNSTQVPVPPRLLRLALGLLGRGDIWDKVGGNLVVSTDPLQGLGFEWRINIRDGLFALGQSSKRVSAHRPR